MIDFYYWPTPNGKKVAIMLEECGLPYATRPINILKGEQFDPEFLTISPNNKVPAIVDQDGPGDAPLSLFESGAILTYLGEKTGRFLPTAPRERYRTLEWLNFQTASLGPMFGQCGHFIGYAPQRIPYAIDRYQNETKRLYGVLDERLAGRDFVVGDFSIVDMAIFPWIDVRWLHEIEIDAYPRVKEWFERVAARPAVQRGMALLQEEEVIGNPSEETREALFGQSQVNRERA